MDYSRRGLTATSGANRATPPKIWARSEEWKPRVPGIADAQHALHHDCIRHALDQRVAKTVLRHFRVQVRAVLPAEQKDVLRLVKENALQLFDERRHEAPTAWSRAAATVAFDLITRGCPHPGWSPSRLTVTLA